MPRFKSMVLLGLVITVIASLSLMAVYLLFSNNYEEFITWFLNRVHKPHLLKTASSFLSQQQFILLRIVAILLSATVLCLIVVAYKKRTSLLARTTSLIEQLESAFIGFINNLPPTGKMQRGLFFFLVGFYIIRTTFSIIYYPIDFDEADTYMLFSSQGPLVSATFYPLPNNHILFSIITSITSMLPIDPVYALRLPLLPIGLLCMMTLYSLLKKYFSQEAALLGLAFFIAAYPLFIYSFLARGYLLLLFFYIISLYCIFELCFSDQYRKRHRYLLVLSSVAGLYTIPSFLYALAGLFLFAFATLLLQRKIAAIVGLMKTAVFIALAAAMLYLPVLISLKWSLLKPYMTPVYDRSNTLTAFTTSFGYLSKTFLSPLDWLAFCFGCCFLVALFFLLRSRQYFNKAVAFFVLLQFVLPFVIFFLFRQQFPPKPWMHLTVVTAFLFAAAVHLLLNRIRLHSSFVFSVVLVLISSGTIISYRYKNESIVTGYNHVAKQCEKLLIEKKLKEVYTEIPYYKTMIDYYAIKNKLQVSLFNSRTSSRRYTPFDPQKKYDLIIIPSQKSKLPPLLYTYDTVMQQNNTIVLLIRQ